jgi:hypothetical protein
MVSSESEHAYGVIAIALLFVRMLCDRFKSRRQLEAKILILRLLRIRSLAGYTIDRSTVEAVYRQRITAKQKSALVRSTLL